MVRRLELSHDQVALWVQLVLAELALGILLAEWPKGLESLVDGRLERGTGSEHTMRPSCVYINIYI